MSNKLRFEFAKTGDLVYSRLHGEGVVSNFDNVGCIECMFGELLSRSIWFFLDGRIYPDDVEPVLFYRDNQSMYLTEKPILKVPWNKVPKDTKVYVKPGNSRFSLKRYFNNYSNGIVYCISDGLTSWSGCTCEKYDIDIDDCQLAEDIIIDGVNYETGLS
jgi:hypothetical protein